MFPVTQHPGADAQHTRLVYEGFFGLDGTVVTIVASLSHMDREDPECVTEWRVYWSAFLQERPEDERINWCAQHGVKLPEEVARAMFPRVEGPYRD